MEGETMVKFDASHHADYMETVLLKQMQAEFELMKVEIIKEYQNKLKAALVQVATKFAIHIHQHMDDYNRKNEIQLKVVWPDEKTETEDSSEEVEGSV
jgi:hypothetical protein